MALTKEEYHRDFAIKVIDLLKRDLAPWTRPWKPGELVPPRNIITGRAYTGGNVVRCWVEAAICGFVDQRWGTYRQITEIGGQVRKGERSIHLLRPISGRKRKTKQDEKRQASMFGDAEPSQNENKKNKPSKSKGSEDQLLSDDDASDEHFLRYFRAFRVFNAEQADGVPEPEEWQRKEDAENVLNRSGASIQHTGEDRAYYDLPSDRIVLPFRSRFHDAAGYYGVALHELGHWTGHHDRLNRYTLVTPTRFGSRIYAREELRAEIASLMISAHLGLGHDPKRCAAYVKSWIKVLEDKHSEIYHASSDAQSISDYILDPQH